MEGRVVKGKTLALDATFIKAWSRRDPFDDGKGLSDPESRVGRDGKTYDLGYKAHLAVDVESDMPVAAVVASANENEKHAKELLDKASLAVDGFKAVVANSQYSSKRVRECILEHVAEPVVPYMSIRFAVSLFSGLTDSSGPVVQMGRGGSMGWVEPV